jgi:hypothetical protein
MSVIDRPNQCSKWGFPPFVHMHDTAYVTLITAYVNCKVLWKHACSEHTLGYIYYTVCESSGLFRLLRCNHFSLRKCAFNLCGACHLKS